MTKKYLNALAEDLRIERLAVAQHPDEVQRGIALAVFDRVVETVVIGLKRANPRVDRDRFWDAVLAA